ncbi:hypothetical protein PCH_Pc12g01530 [Penicillium rubens Wisconsin 54-1255]|uniref:Uncharacterized protein n=1 Tax=Penicillium rubens (strain ATCC 28089 / DSM 1075 / NRRL 1951 / Wisconsin 54-1255) TaxID=500485 RepID=B6GYT8_PENRW|nr:hypothetical protein PCH_Pc12g01530 [Penicillium rubens Wisconsin 54-1255]
MSLVIEEEEGIELSCLSRGIVQEKTSHLYPGACTGANAGEFITAIVGVAWLGQAKPKIRQFGSTENKGYMVDFTDYLNHQRSQHKGISSPRGRCPGPVPSYTASKLKTYLIFWNIWDQKTGKLQETSAVFEEMMKYICRMFVSQIRESDYHPSLGRVYGAPMHDQVRYRIVIERFRSQEPLTVTFWHGCHGVFSPYLRVQGALYTLCIPRCAPVDTFGSTMIRLHRANPFPRLASA